MRLWATLNPLFPAHSALAVALAKGSHCHEIGSHKAANTATDISAVDPQDLEDSRDYCSCKSEPQAAALRTKTKFGTTSSSKCFLGLDLAFNAVGHAGIIALSQALTAAPGMAFLELRGNSGNDDRSLSGGLEHTSEALEQVKKTCAARRRQLKSLREGARRTSSLLASARANAQRLTQPDETLKAGASGGMGAREAAVGIGSSGRQNNMIPPATVATRMRRCSSVLDESERPQHDGELSGTGSPADGNGTRRRQVLGAASAFCPIGISRQGSAAKPRPLEGALPMRGYYVSTLLDSCFDLLMLREPVPDPDDASVYVNQARNKLEERRVLREQRAGGDRASGKGAGDAGEGRGPELTPFPKGTVGEKA